MNSIVIDSSRCKSTLCDLAARCGTDKGPYNMTGGHRHPYTTPYSLFLEPLRHRQIKFAEVGVHRGASVLVWRNFFSRARIYGFDIDKANCDFIASANLNGVILDTMDGSSPSSIRSQFAKHTEDGELFDVIIDDASHNPEHQRTMIEHAMRFLKQGGFLIVEDIFRDTPEGPFEEVLQRIKDQVCFHTFIVCDHENRYSPGWNNDKMLILVKN